MENPLCLLKSVGSTLLRMSSTSWAMDMLFAFLCGLVLFILLIPFLQTNPSFSLAGKKNSRKNHMEKKGQKKTSRRSCILKAFRECRRELEETGDLLLLLQRLLQKLPGNAEVNHLSHGDVPEPQEDQPALRRLPPGTGPQDSGLSKSYLQSLIRVLSGPDLLHHCLSFFSWCWATAKATFFSSWAHGKSQQEHPSHHPPDTVFWEGPSHWQAEVGRGDHAFIHPDVHKLLEMLISKRVKQKMRQEKPKDGSFFQLVNTDYPWISLRNLLKSLGDKLTSAQLFCNTKDKAEWLLGSQQPSLHKVLGSPLEHECSLLFWGPPSLHSESLVATAWAGGRSSSTRSHCIKFNEAHTHIPGPSLQDSPLVLPSVQPPAQLLCFPQKPQLTCPSQVRACGTTCSTSQKKAQSFLPIENQDLQWTLQKPLKWRQALNSKLQKGQEPISLPTLNLPQGSQASEAPQAVSILSGDSNSAELQEKPECHRSGAFSRDEGSENLPHPALRLLPSQDLMQPLGKLPEKCQGRVQDSYSATQPTQTSAPTCGRNKTVQNTGSQSSGRAFYRGLVTLKLEDRRNVQQNASEDRKDTFRGVGCTPWEVQGDKGAQSNIKGPEKYDAGSHFSRGPDPKDLQKDLGVHLSRKFWQINEGMIPVCVRRSWLIAKCTLPKSNTHTPPIMMTCYKGKKTCVNSTQGLSFLDPRTPSLLEAHIKNYRLRQKCGPLFQNLEPRNIHVGEAQALPPPLPSFASSAPSDSRTDFITKLATFQQEIPGKVAGLKETAQTLFPILQSTIPVARSPAWKEVQKVSNGTLSDDNNGPSDIPLSAQEVRLPSAASTQWSSTAFRNERGSLVPTPGPEMAKHDLQEGTRRMAFEGTCHGIPVLEIKLLSPLSVAKESRKPEVKEKHPAWEITLGTRMMENSQNININLRTLGSPYTSNHSSSLSRDSTHQNQAQNVKRKEHSHLDIDMLREGESCSQNVCTDSLQDCHTVGLLSTVIQPSQTSVSNSQGTLYSNTPTLEVPCDPSVRGVNNQWEQESSMSRFHDAVKSSSKISGSNNQSKNYRKPRPGNEEQSSAGERPFCTYELSPPAQVMEVDSYGSMSCPHVPEKGQIPTESLIRKKMKHSLQCHNPNKECNGQESSMQKPKPSSASAQTLASITNRKVRNREVVGPILVDKLGLHQASVPSGINLHVAGPPEPVGMHSCYHRASSSPDKRTMVKDMACAHHDSHNDHSHPTKSMWIRDRDNNQATPRACAPSSQGHQRSKDIGASGYLQPHDTLQSAVLSHIPQTYHAFSSETNLFAEEMY
uniref:Spermatogenesis-associated protein 31E1-like n=1 Tax=Chinchilla lanigera TaxID=34839 RepID=A0A8C2UPB9_CHILA